MLKSLSMIVAFAVLGCTAPRPASVDKGQGGMPFSIDKVSESFDGVATEVLQVPSYTYVAVAPDGGGDVRWAVSLKEKVPQGARVHVRSFGQKHGFASKKLDRTFENLSFAIIHVVVPQEK